MTLEEVKKSIKELQDEFNSADFSKPEARDNFAKHFKQAVEEAEKFPGSLNYLATLARNFAFTLKEHAKSISTGHSEDLVELTELNDIIKSFTSQSYALTKQASKKGNLAATYYLANYYIARYEAANNDHNKRQAVRYLSKFLFGAGNSALSEKLSKKIDTTQEYLSNNPDIGNAVKERLNKLKKDSSSSKKKTTKEEKNTVKESSDSEYFSAQSEPDTSGNATSSGSGSNAPFDDEQDNSNQSSSEDQAPPEEPAPSPLNSEANPPKPATAKTPEPSETTVKKPEPKIPSVDEAYEKANQQLPAHLANDKQFYAGGEGLVRKVIKLNYNLDALQKKVATDVETFSTNLSNSVLEKDKETAEEKAKKPSEAAAKKPVNKEAEKLAKELTENLSKLKISEQLQAEYKALDTGIKEKYDPLTVSFLDVNSKANVLIELYRETNKKIDQIVGDTKKSFEEWLKSHPQSPEKDREIQAAFAKELEALNKKQLENLSFMQNAINEAADNVTALHRRMQKNEVIANSLNKVTFEGKDLKPGSELSESGWCTDRYGYRFNVKDKIVLDFSSTGLNFVDTLKFGVKSALNLSNTQKDLMIYDRLVALKAAGYRSVEITVPLFQGYPPDVNPSRRGFMDKYSTFLHRSEYTPGIEAARRYWRQSINANNEEENTHIKGRNGAKYIPDESDRNYRHGKRAIDSYALIKGTNPALYKLLKANMDTQLKVYSQAARDRVAILTPDEARKIRDLDPQTIQTPNGYIQALNKIRTGLGNSISGNTDSLKALPGDVIRNTFLRKALLDARTQQDDEPVLPLLSKSQIGAINALDFANYTSSQQAVDAINRALNNGNTERNSLLNVEKFDYPQVTKALKADYPELNKRKLDFETLKEYIFSIDELRVGQQEGIEAHLLATTAPEFRKAIEEHHSELKKLVDDHGQPKDPGETYNKIAWHTHNLIIASNNSHEKLIKYGHLTDPDLGLEAKYKQLFSTHLRTIDSALERLEEASSDTKINPAAQVELSKEAEILNKLRDKVAEKIIGAEPRVPKAQGVTVKQNQETFISISTPGPGGPK